VDWLPCAIRRGRGFTVGLLSAAGLFFIGRARTAARLMPPPGGSSHRLAGRAAWPVGLVPPSLSRPAVR